MCHLHHVSAILILEVKVEVQPVTKVADAIHVEKLLEVIFLAMMHGVILIVPCCRVHHGGSSGSVARSKFGWVWTTNEARAEKQAQDSFRAGRQKREAVARVAASSGLHTEATIVVE